MMEFTDEKPKRNVDYDHWLADGEVVVKGMISQVKIRLLINVSIETFMRYH